MVLNHSISLACIYWYLSVLDHCHHSASHAMATVKRNLNFANFTGKEDGERKVNMMIWAFPDALRTNAQSSEEKTVKQTKGNLAKTNCKAQDRNI